MNLISFKGGIHPPYRKESTKDKPILALPACSELIIPLQQHLGAPCDPLVKKGDTVLLGQKIGESTAFVSSPVHASVSGIVKAVEKRLHPGGMQVLSVVIENDHADTLSDEIRPYRDISQMSSEEMISAVRGAGIVGMGGAGFPIHVKLSVPQGKKVEYVIVNGAECEPYLSSDHRAMLEYPDEMIDGLRAIMKAVGAEKGIVAIEDNKLDAEAILTKKLIDDPSIEVAVMETKYPQGSEKHIIKAVTGREIPAGSLPIDVGCLVNNIDTCIAVSAALKEGMPIYKRRVTLSGGCVANPGVYEVRIGTPFSKLIEKAGGLSEEPTKVIMGGPMMGICQYSLDAPVIKTTSGLLCLSAAEAHQHQEGPCLRCGKCVGVCPMNLMPYSIAAAGRADDLEKGAKYNADSCIECGCCSYVCPASRRLVESIRLSKAKVIALKSKK